MVAVKIFALAAQKYNGQYCQSKFSLPTEDEKEKTRNRVLLEPP
jgi:hypothetical protein